MTNTTQPTTILGHLSAAIRGSLSVVTSTATAAEETVGIATGFVHNRAMEQKHVDKAFVQQRAARKLRELQIELDADDDLKDLLGKLDADW